MLDSYSGATRVLFIVGDPIAQVKSPAAVTHALRNRGFDIIVVPTHVAPADLADFFTMARRLANVDGIIVTVPHKLAAAALANSLTPRARSIGAVNMLRRDATGGWFGDTCDGEGYVTGLRNAGCELSGTRALIVGAGGAGSAIAHALVDAGVAVLALHDHDAARREKLLAQLRHYGAANVREGSNDPSDFDLVINATPLGMRGNDPLPVEVERLEPDIFVGDVVTQPVVTPLLAAAQARGCRTMNGMGMFEAVCQGLVTFYTAAVA